MLIIARKLGESIVIGDHYIKITVTEIKGKQVKFGVEAPREIVVYREEIFERFKQKQREL